MPAKTGKEYIDRVDKAKANVWINGEQVKDRISQHPAFKGVMKTQAELYDLQHDSAKNEIMTYISPTSNERVGTSFMQPRTKEDLEKRRKMIQEWARHNNGMMGRSPDYINSGMMAYGTAADMFGTQDSAFAKNMKDYYELCREKDLSLTHTLIQPQVNRGVSAAKLPDPYIAARIAGKNSEGLIIKGARLLATQGGITDEIMVFPSTLLKQSEEENPYAFAFSIPNNTPGLKFICRESFDYGKSHFDHPLGSRFEEMDTIIVFDDVVVPWNRVFAYGDVGICNQAYNESNAVVHMTHQVVSKNIAKTEFILGILQLMVETINIGQYQHVQEKISEVIIALETVKAFIIASEANAKVDKWGMMTPDFTPLNIARNYYPKIYPRFSEIMQQLGASGLMAIPNEADFNSELRPDLDKYLQAANGGAYDRVKLYRLAWDVCMSSFGSRQTLYERFFFGDPVRMASALYNGYDKQEYVDRVKEFLNRTENLAEIN
ncbi:4-hydroxyphenylacetate 3-monooxygenase, oxygenase component [Peribacillus simplex]|uniref:4-hydroxyphenylacetate 3-monooxygenase, oxygenase component n=1 Tax=Peribacillus simplex NBRC 15720 = DSM 1321 TaxID=1349754 RepID=A0A223EMN4_9BACI|nr:4-hydroxyphenylacetate 3-monooxygenase, oxygenase component [Peribacillus simplex]ASS96431.1 4-hydroxyphenylacetate 3-monooxygenase, oxygenase component [Peribacillus simplex NBRC 15720 = DSM 1321]MEC1397565.1 4-hydroxyphenylacetate 3-monooxygenase, oxygenase component [Peribacillus simplex]MED3911031.1 4-hydroxyphenylacetate 3-monooxygenase, oxygenase component [Peribacillus simplex]